jgi:prepilin-type N-terminal cleavage/methylation domain-containing protein
MKKAFTLVELMVAISVFSVAVTLATGAFVRAIKTQRILTHLMSVNSNSSLVIEQLAREMRTGYNFSLARANSPDCDDLITFTRSSNGVQVSYRWSGVQSHSIEKSTGENGSFVSITASNVSVNRLCFIKNQLLPEDPWRITILATLGPTDVQVAKNVFNLQTTISSRLLPNEVQL